MMRTNAAAAILAMVCLHVGAQDRPPTIQQLEAGQKTRQQIEQINHAMKSLDNLAAMAQAIAEKKATECQKAFGHEAFCKCLGDNIPFDYTLADYVTVTTHTKADNGYSGLPLKMRTAYDLALAAREKCVAGSFGQ